MQSANSRIMQRKKHLNPLTTDDECTRCATSAAIHFEARFAVAKKGGIGEVGGHSHDMLCTWWLSSLAGRNLSQHWLDHLLAQAGIEMAPLPL